MAGAGYQVGKGFTVGAAQVNPTGTMTITPSTTGGTLVAGTYYARWTWVTANGETLPTNTQSTTTTGTTSSILFQPPSFPSGVTAANIYVGTVSGQESYQGQINTSGASLTLTSLTNGKPVPQWNATAYQDIKPSTLGLTDGTNEFIVHDIYYNNAVAFGIWDSVSSTLVMFDGDTGNGARMDLSIHCNGSQWLRIFNQATNATLQTSVDGIQMV